MTVRANHGFSLVELLRQRAASTPGRPAFTFLDASGAESGELTWAGLDARARAVAAALQEAGAKGERALLLHPPGLGFIASFLGCLYAGAVAVPAYPPGRNRPPARLRSIAADARARVVLAPAAIVSGSQALTEKAPELGGASWIDTDGLEPGLADAWRETAPAPDEPAFLQYTSGSTSEPKGVVVTHANLLHNEEAIRRAFGMSESSVVVGWLPLYHDMGLIGNVLQPLYAGARAVLMAPLSFLQRPALWLEAVSRYRGTTSGGPNFAYDLCVRKAGGAENVAKAALDLSCWEVAFNGSEPVRAGTIERFTAAFAGCGFRREAFYPCYGLAEATLFVSGGEPGAPPVVRPGAGSRPLVGCGRAADGHTVTIADPEARTLLPSGQVGEIWVAGPSVAAGYWARPEETEATFGARLADGEGPFLRTGDLGFLADGELFVTGRLKDLIILRGRNHYPHDLERTAEASHPALRPGGGAAFPVDRDGEERLVILHEVERASSSNPAAAAEAIRRALAEEHEVAAEEIVLVRSGTILKTTSGKIRRAACRTAYLEGDLAVVFRTGTVPPEQAGLPGLVPDEPLLQELAAEAARILRRDVREIDAGAPLVSLGLDSLAAAELRSALEERTGAAVPLQALLEGMSLRELAAEGRTSGGPPRPARAVEPDAPGEHPLSEGQRALWFLDRLNPGAAALHLAGAARVRGGLDAAALRRALVLLTARHPALRTTFEAQAGEPVRRVHAGLAPDFQEGAADEDALPGLLAEEAYRPFDLDREPLLRVRTWTLPGGGAALLIAVHHLVMDYASSAVLLRDLAQLYEQERGGPPASLPPPGPGMTSWIRSQEEALAGPRGERLRGWWHGRLAGDLPVLDLPADRSQPPVRSWRGIVRTIRLDGGAEALRSVARSQGITLYSALLAAFQAVLHRWTGQDETLVGAPAAERRIATMGMEGEIGYFVNLVPLRLSLSGEPSFAELAARAGSVAVEAFEHGGYPFPRLARELRLDRDPGRSIVRAMLVLQPGRSAEERALSPFALGEDGARAALGGLELESIALPESRAQLDCLLMAAEAGDGALALSLQLDADLFDPATAGRLLGHLASFLRAAAADPGRQAGAVEILSAAERRQLSAWSAGPALEPAGECLHELIAEQAERTPEATALVHGDDRLTYRELRERARLLADHLRGLGIGPEVKVGVCAGRTPETLVGLLAVLEAGGAYVPLDPAHPAERLAYLLEDSGAALLLEDGSAGERLRSAGSAGLPRVRLDRPLEAPARPAPPPRRTQPENLAYLIYTSGSTGRPKAVGIEHRSAVALARWAKGAFTQRELDGVLAVTPLGFDLSVFEILVPLCWGGRVVFAGSALDLPEIPASSGARLVNTVPSAVAELLRAGSLPGWVETVNVAGEPLRRELVRALFDAGVRRVVNLYGPSEDTTYSTIGEQERDGRGEPPIGRPVAGTRARVVDGALRPVPAGVAGELLLAGAGLARGYLGRPDLTAGSFIPSPFAEDGPGARLYRTGDRVRRRADGELVFLGRLDHQVKIRGYRIEPGEIENALAAHPQVGQAAVLALGEGAGRRLVAYVTPAPPLDLRSWLAGRLPEPLIPSAFVFLKSLPLTPNGKVDRKALAELAPGGPSPRPGYEPPRTALETALAAVWAEVLGLDRIGVHDDVFDLGGHSLLAVRAQARVRERLRIDLPLPALFRAPTVAGLARLAALAAKAPPWNAPPPRPRPRDGSPLPLSFAQERMWLLHRLDPGSPAYHLPGELRLAGPLDRAALAAAVGELARCHEALRTRFVESADTGGGPVQVVEAWTQPELPVVCLEALPRAVRASEAARLAREEARRPFELAAEFPIRALLLRLERGEHLLLLTLHHIAADEASLAILARDLGASLATGSPLAQPLLQIADVAIWQRELMRGDALEARLAWWEARLADLPPLELPADRPAGGGDRGGAVSVPLPAETVAALAALGRESGATLFMVLLAGFQAFLSRLSGAVDFAVGSPFANRDRRELEGVVGPLLNTLALRADLTGDPAFRELLGRVREATIAAHERADLPFELLVERLRPGRTLGANPLFDAMFVLHRPPGPLRAGELTIEPRPVATGAAKVELTLYALEREEGLELELEYQADRWDRATAARLLDGLAGLLAGVAADPGLRLSGLPMVLDGQRRAVLRRAPAAPVARAAAPRTPMEELLGGIWEDLLGIERPGIHDDFFELGGQSLLAARVVSRLRKALGVELPLRALFEARTLGGLAARVEAARVEAARTPGDLPEPPLVALPRSAGMSLSFGQERLWFMDRLDPGSPVYNMAAAVALRGALDPEALRAALQGIAARHDVLRAAFPAPGGTPVQVPAEASASSLPRVDLSALPPCDRQREALRRASAEAVRPFDLEAGPPLRTTLLRLDGSEHVLLVTVHHIAFDGWSMGIFLRELSALYGAGPVPGLPVQYADFAAWQRRRLEGGALDPHLAWWRETLAGAPPVLALPLDRPRPPVQTFRGGSLRISLAPETSRAVRALARGLAATPFMTLLAVWAALLARHTHEGEDLVVGTAVAGRGRVELEPLIGLFAENLVLRLDLGGDPGFDRLVARARETTLSAWAHQDVPFERLVRELRPERDLSHSPLYQTALTLDASDRPPLELPGLRLELLPLESGTAKLDLALYLDDQGGGISGLLEYNRDLFDPTTALRLLSAFERLVVAVTDPAGPPGRRLSELPVLSEAERHQLLRELTGGDGAPQARPVLVPRLVEARAAAEPEAPAVSGDGRTLSYRELGRRAGRLARRLRGLGVGPEVRVAVCLPRIPELIAALLGIWKAGGVYVPLDPTHPEERLAALVEDSRAAVLLASRRGPEPPPGSPAVVYVEDFAEPGGDGETASVPLPPESAAYLVYTSGSTGRPKGVLVSHGALAAYAASVAGLYGVRPGDRVLQSASVAFDLSLDEIVPSLIGGAELVLRDDAMLASVAGFLEGCRERGITVLVLPTAYWHEIASRLETEDLALPPGLRLVTTGGERLLPERLAAWRRRFPSGPLFNTYGPTEATIQVTGADLNVQGRNGRPEAPIGRPLPGAGVWLLDPRPEGLGPVPLGAAGEVCLGGSVLARGYLGQPDRTAERFVPHPFPDAPGARLYRTGDLARFLADGSLEFAGRIDGQVKVRGYRVEPGEVEAVLARHPRVEAAAVVAWGGGAGGQRLAAYVAARPPAPTAAELRSFLSESLPEPLVPSDILFLDELPRTPHGKVDRRALPAPSGTRAEAEHVPPRSEAERALAGIWRETLGLERVGANDNFFELGGHSLALARVHVLLKERLGCEVSIVDLFRYPTVASLARRLALAESGEDSGPSIAEQARQRAERSRPAARQGRFLAARKRMPAMPVMPTGTPPPPIEPPSPWGADAEALHARLSPASAAFLRFAAAHPEALERASFAELAHHGVGSPYPLQPWPAFVDRARVAEMERVSTGIARLIKSLPSRVFGNDPERLREFYDLPGADLARMMVQPPDGLAAAIGRGDFLDSPEGLKCLEFNMLSALGGWEAPLWAEAYLRVPVLDRLLRQERLRAACRDTVSLLLAHAVAEARELSGGEINVALVTPEQTAAHGHHLEAWLAGRYAEALGREAPGAHGALAILPYAALRERAGALWAGERRIHAAVELHEEGTAAQALRCFRAGSLKLFNAPVRTVLTDKRNLALLSELADGGGLLSPDERELVARHVPWSRRLDRAAASRQGREVWLPELALAAREELVIKKARAGRGSAVHLGAATPQALWRERVERALDEGDWIVQEQVEPLPYVHQQGERGWGPHDVVWGLFVLGDRYGGGFLSLAPREARTRVEGGVVNVMRGATVGVILEVLNDE